jgi:hypothetical protein
LTPTALNKYFLTKEVFPKTSVFGKTALIFIEKAGWFKFHRFFGPFQDFEPGGDRVLPKSF